MKPLMPNWLAFLVIVGLFILSTAIGGPSDHEAAVATELAVKDLHQQAAMAGGN